MPNLTNNACRKRKAALEALFARGKEDEAAEDAILEQAKVIEAKRRAEASARRPAPVGAFVPADCCAPCLRFWSCLRQAVARHCLLCVGMWCPAPRRLLHV